MDRRKFLQFAGLATAGNFLPELALANRVNAAHSTQVTNNKKIVVLVHLKGANDGFNTLVHYGDRYYQNLRPTIALKERYLVRLNERIGMHPQLAKLENLWRDNDMAWVQGVGYPNGILSHPRSLEVWENASASKRNIGWLSHVLPHYKSGLHGIVIDQGIGNSAVLSGRHTNAIAMNTPSEFLKLVRDLPDVHVNAVNPAIAHVSRVQQQTYAMGRHIADKLSTGPRHIAGHFTGGGVGRSLQSVARMILSGVDAPVYKVVQPGFDSHSDQLKEHSNALFQLSEGLNAFAMAMKQGGMWNNVVVMTYSEFGRRAKENKSAGTDHGTASVQMLLGGQINGGIYGQHPNLQRLDGNNNVQHIIDFRTVYGTVVRRWWGQRNPWHDKGYLRFLT